MPGRSRISARAVGCLLAALVLLAGLTGCGRGLSGASGTVHYKSQPIVGADVAFLPKDETPESKPARGRTDAQGRFTLQTYFGPGDEASGALPGEYVVTVQKIDEPEGIVDPLKGPLPKNQLPAKYSSAQQSPLKATVGGGSSDFPLMLED